MKITVIHRRTRLRAACELLIAVLLLGFHIPAATAHLVLDMLERPTAQLVRDAFSTPYGRLNIAEFDKVLRESADAECLRAARIDPATLETGGRELLIANGIRIVEAYVKLVDKAKLEAAFAARVGPKGREEFARLRSHPELRKVAELTEAGKLAGLVDFVTEKIDNHVVAGDLGLRRFGFMTTANPVLMEANPADAGREELERALDRRKTPQLLRWRELSEAVWDAVREATDNETYSGVFPAGLGKVLGDDLKKLCVRAR